MNIETDLDYMFESNSIQLEHKRKYTCTLKKESNCSASGISIASPENPSSEKNKMHTIK